MNCQFLQLTDRNCYDDERRAEWSFVMKTELLLTGGERGFWENRVLSGRNERSYLLFNHESHALPWFCSWTWRRIVTPGTLIAIDRIYFTYQREVDWSVALHASRRHQFVTFGSFAIRLSRHVPAAFVFAFVSHPRGWKGLLERYETRDTLVADCFCCCDIIIRVVT